MLDFFKKNKIITTSVDDLFEMLKYKYDRLEEENASLRKTHADLIDGIYEKDEMKQLKECYDEMHSDLLRGFPISAEEQKIIDEFKNKHKGDYGAIGGAFKYEFIPTSIGTTGTIIAPNGDRLEFQTIK